MTPIQPHLDGTIPTPTIPAARRKAEDYETWLEEAWPFYIAAAASGETYTIYEIAERHRISQPPDSHMWGRLATLLREAGYHRPVGWTTSPRPTSHHSGLRTWKGTAAARRAAA
ncbi:hypothetical protein ACIGO7_35600 [Streptomyces virginiae]|uniref:hypothetical protein n=1 Tax=Streptomyces virginiae TaxID=1961 RepID=UPI0034509F40